MLAYAAAAEVRTDDWAGLIRDSVPTTGSPEQPIWPHNGLPWKWRRRIVGISETKLEPPCTDCRPDKKSALQGSGKWSRRPAGGGDPQRPKLVCGLENVCCGPERQRSWEIINNLTQRRQGAKIRKIQLHCSLCVLCYFAPLREMLLLAAGFLHTFRAFPHSRGRSPISVYLRIAF